VGTAGRGDTGHSHREDTAGMEDNPVGRVDMVDNLGRQRDPSRHSIRQHSGKVGLVKPISWKAAGQMLWEYRPNWTVFEPR